MNILGPVAIKFNSPGPMLLNYLEGMVLQTAGTYKKIHSSELNINVDSRFILVPANVLETRKMLGYKAKPAAIGYLDVKDSSASGLIKRHQGWKQDKENRTQKIMDLSVIIESPIKRQQIAKEMMRILSALENNPDTHKVIGDVPEATLNGDVITVDTKLLDYARAKIKLDKSRY